MSQREKIILLLLALAIIVGGYMLLTPSIGKNQTVVGKAPQIRVINSMVVKAASELDGNLLTEAETYAVALAEQEWARDDLFLNRPPPSAKSDPVEANPLLSNFLYSGFLKVADFTMAIINGLEYKVGQIIEPGEYVVRAIHPRKVVIEMTEQHADFASSPSETRRLIIPLAE